MGSILAYNLTGMGITKKGLLEMEGISSLPQDMGMSYAELGDLGYVRKAGKSVAPWQ